MCDITRKAVPSQAIPSAPGSFQAVRVERIPAIDLGKFNSVACDYDTATGTHTFTTLPTRPQAMHDLLIALEVSDTIIDA